MILRIKHWVDDVLRDSASQNRAYIQRAQGYNREAVSIPGAGLLFFREINVDGAVEQSFRETEKVLPRIPARPESKPVELATNLHQPQVIVEQSPR